MKASELSEKTSGELVQLERELRDELFRLRMKHYSGQLQSPSEIREKRRTIARIKTVLTQKQG